MIIQEDIVKLVARIRKDKKISQRLLGRAVCSGQQLSKLEKGACVPDFFLLEALLQRLGRTTDDLEIVMSEEEFAGIRLRDEIIDALRRGRTAEAKKRLNNFRGIMRKDSILWQLQLLRLEGACALEEKKYIEAEENLRQAAPKVIAADGQPGADASGEILLTETELETLLLLAQTDLELGRKQEAEALLTFFHAYVRKELADEEHLAKFLPKLALTACRLAERSGRPETCVPLCEESLHLLRRHGMLQQLTPILGYLATYYEKINREKDARTLRIWKETVEQLYLQFGLSADIVNKLYFSSCTGQYYLTGELLREERIAQGLSQEQLAEGIYQDPETLSRVENGRKPDEKKLQLLFARLNIRKKHYNDRLFTDNYFLLELYNEMSILLAREEKEESIWRLKMLRKRLDMSIPENRQIIECFETINQCEEGRLSGEEALEKLYQLLRLTYRIGHRRVPFNEEALLLNQIGDLLALLGRRDEAIELRKRVIGIYEKSSLPLKYHFRTVYPIMENMTLNMEQMDDITDMEKWSRRIIKDDLENGTGNRVHIPLWNLVKAEWYRQGDTQLCQKWLRQAYHLTDMFLQAHDQKDIASYAKKIFGKEPEWY